MCWQLLAPAIASGDQRVRVSHDGGRSYPQRGQRVLTVERPRQPAAVRLYDKRGHARTLALDLDAGRAGRAQVLSDCQRITQLISAAGGVPLVDESDSGGRHVYLLLARPRHLDELRPVLQRLQALLPSLDPAPMSNTGAGCLRPPGATHRGGGTQRLLTAWPTAVHAVYARTSDTAWAAFTDCLGASSTDDPASPRRATPASPRPPSSESTTGTGTGSGTGDREAVFGGLRLPPPHLAVIARTGSYAPGAYRSPSEARFAVVCSLAARGWSWQELALRMEDATYPGLRTLYARYKAGWRKALLRDWRKALSLPAVNRSERPAVNCNTRVPSPQRAAPSLPSTQLSVTAGNAPGSAGEALEYRWIRAWWSCVEVMRPDITGRGAPALLGVLTALGAAAQKTGTRVVSFGTRSLELAAGCDHTTVSRALKVLCSAEDPLIDLVQRGRGRDGDTYTLRIPDALAHVARSRAWTPGPIRQVHEVFRVLGLPAWLAHDAVTTRPGNTTEIADRTGMSRDAAAHALHVLADHGLVRRAPQAWEITPAGGRDALDRVARHIGAVEVTRSITAAHRRDRDIWHAYLAGVHALDRTHTVYDMATAGEWWQTAAPHDPLWREEPPPDPGRTAIELLQDLLGATVLS